MNPFQSSLRDEQSFTRSFPALKGRAKINRRCATKDRFCRPLKRAEEIKIFSDPGVTCFALTSGYYLSRLRREIPLTSYPEVLGYYHPSAMRDL